MIVIICLLMRKLVCLCLLTIASFTAFSQNLNDSFRALNVDRIHTNKIGMHFLQGFGIGSVIGSSIGLSRHNTPQNDAFYRMNIYWGLANLGISVLGSVQASREARLNENFGASLHRYEATRRLYLFNGSLDVLYIGTGVYLLEHANNPSSADPQTLKGYGKAVITQGASLLLFDAIMYYAHSRKAKQWYRGL